MKRFTNCRRCPKQIVMLVYPKTGKAAPIEAESNPAGNVVWTNDGTYRFATADDPPEERRFNHLARCGKGEAINRKPAGRLKLAPMGAR